MQERNIIVRFLISEQEQKKLNDFTLSKGISKSEFFRSILNSITKTDKQERKKRNRFIKLSLTEEEHNLLEKATKLNNFDYPTTYIYSLLRENLTGNALGTKDEISQLAKSFSELRKIGTNINQIARAVNSDVQEINNINLEILEKMKKSINIELQTLTNLLKKLTRRHEQ